MLLMCRYHHDCDGGDDDDDDVGGDDDFDCRCASYMQVS